MWIRWANAANLKIFFDHFLILNKIFRYFFYPFDHALTCWYWEFKIGISICIRKTFNNTCNVLYQHLLNTLSNGLLRLTSIGWHFEVQPAGFCRIWELLSNNWALSPWVKCAAIASNDSNEFSNLSLLHSASVCLNEISSIQTFTKSSYIQPFFCVLTIKTGGMFKLQTVCSVFTLKMIMVGNICPPAVADVLFFFTPWGTNNTIPLAFFRSTFW